MSRVFSSANTGANANFVDTPSSAVYNNLAAFTWSAWVFPTASPDSDFSPIIVKNPSNAYTAIQFNGNGTTTLLATLGDGTDTQIATTVSNDLLTLNAWSNVVMTFNFNGDKKIHIYVNAVEIDYSEQQALIGPLPNDSAEGFYFGNDIFGDGWDGNIAEVAVWNTVLTGAQITAVHASTTGVGSIQSANLVGYWHLCGTMSPEPDASGNGNVGTLSTNPPTKGADSPGFNCSGPTPPPVLPWSSTDSRNYGNFPNASREVNQTKTYDVQTSSNPAVPGVDSRTAGAPVDCRVAPNIPENSRTPGLYGPNEP